MTLVILFFLSKSSITNVFNLACSLSTISTFLLVTATTLMFFSNSARIVSPPVYPEAPNTTTRRGLRCGRCGSGLCRRLSIAPLDLTDKLMMLMIGMSFITLRLSTFANSLYALH